IIYLHYTKYDERVVPRKRPAIRIWNTQLVFLRKELEMKRGEFGMVDVIEHNEDDEENERHKEKELEDAIRESGEKFPGDERLELFADNLKESLE
ncbi:hypothetical protein Tco_0459380, partial [Tanacetum coccineum]